MLKSENGRVTRSDKTYLTYQEAKDKGWNEYACREEELKRRLKKYEEIGLTAEEIRLLMEPPENIYILDDAAEGGEIEVLRLHIRPEMSFWIIDGGFYWNCESDFCNYHEIPVDGLGVSYFLTEDDAKKVLAGGSGADE